MQNITRHPNYAEVHTLLRIIEEHGCTALAFYDGAEYMEPTVENILSVDDGTLSVETPSPGWRLGPPRRIGFLLVYGNEPGEMISDYTDCPEADDIAVEWGQIHPLR